MVAPRVGDEVRALEGVTWEERPYRDDEVADYLLAITATDDPRTNRQVFTEGEAHGVWVNSADDPTNCTFTLPARIRRGDLLVTVELAVPSRLDDKAVEALQSYAEATKDFDPRADLFGGAR